MAWQYNTRQDEIKQPKTRQHNTRQDKTSHTKISQYKTRQNTIIQDKMI